MCKKSMWLQSGGSLVVGLDHKTGLTPEAEGAKIFTTFCCKQALNLDLKWQVRHGRELWSHSCSARSKRRAAPSKTHTAELVQTPNFYSSQKQHDTETEDWEELTSFVLFSFV